jgi:hypothetical protein
VINGVIASVNDDRSGGKVDNDGPICSKLCPDRDVASRFVNSEDKFEDWTLSELNRCCNCCVVVVVVVVVILFEVVDDEVILFIEWPTTAVTPPPPRVVV